jgi:hypothetical protein
MCADSAALNPEFQKFLDMAWLDSTVRDQVQLSYTFLPLPYHHGVWIPHLLVPYILDVCHADATKCIFQEYMEYCFDHQGDMLDAKDTSQDDLIKSWTKQVADQFKLEQSDLLALYDRQNDKHNSEMRTRYMYKYNAHHHVSGTPFAFVNGILLQDFPETAQDWMDMLTAVWAQTTGGNVYI